MPSPAAPEQSRSRRVTRRTVIRAGAGAALGTLSAPALGPGLAFARRPIRRPSSLPDPRRPAGEPTAALPFDHVVVTMMENHSFDNYFGMLPRHGQRAADGFRFTRAGRPANSNPLRGGYVFPYHLPTLCQPVDITQTWNATHIQIDHGRMDGFARTDEGSMGYFGEPDIPFYYSLAKTFTLANRWFCSAPCQTFPNRRFLLAATANGLIATTDTSIFDPLPANGTLFDRLNRYGISWRNYFTDLPGTGVFASIPEHNPDKLAHIEQFLADCASGNLPAVSFVDPEFGATGDVGAGLESLPIPAIAGPTNETETQGGDEENPQDITLGETFVAKVVNAILASPAWRRTLFVWLYDEHGGYYDHVPPPPAIKPDNVPPQLGPGDVKGAYDIYGPRVPAIVVSSHARRHAVTNVVHDHTSIMATIEAKWNLPACTYRDANAPTLVDFLDLHREAFAEPPTLAAPHDLASSEKNCSDADPTLTIGPHPGTDGNARRARRRRHRAGAGGRPSR